MTNETGENTSTTAIGTPGRPLRVAVIGSGPAGFYTIQHLLKADRSIEVDLFDRLPSPFGLVRYGVAPDHQKTKSVAAAYARTASHECFRFYGNVDVGRDVTVKELQRYYHQIVFTTGAQTDRSLGIPGEELEGSHPATAFVAWYNGHPDFRDERFRLDVERAVVVGVGNVALDVARILCRTITELERTDIAEYALDALRASRVKEVILLGRRGPAQAAFTNPELKELGEMEDTDAITISEEVALDPLSRAEVEGRGDRSTQKKLELLEEYGRPRAHTKSKRLVIRFLVSPVEILGDAQGRVRAIRIVRNELYATEGGALRPRATGVTEEIPTGLVFRSVGYLGVPVPGVPFDEKRGIIPNECGRVLDPETGEPIPGLYAAGWIKRGPQGVIGTNKPDALETVKCMLEDLDRGKILSPENPQRDALKSTLADRGHPVITYPDWMRLDDMEVERGREAARPRVKFVTLDEILAALGREG